MATKDNWASKGYDWLRTLSMFDEEELSPFEQSVKAELELLLADNQVDNQVDNEEDIAAYKRGFNWASEHGWVDED